MNKKYLSILVLVLVAAVALVGCASGNGSEAPAEEGDRVFTLEELAEYDGLEGREAYVAVDGVVYKSVVNIGNNPTFNAEKITVESHILDFDGDLYGKTISVELLEYLRPDKKFESIEKLKVQIKQDIETARGIIDKEEY